MKDRKLPSCESYKEEYQRVLQMFVLHLHITSNAVILVTDCTGTCSVACSARILA